MEVPKLSCLCKTTSLCNVFEMFALWLCTRWKLNQREINEERGSILRDILNCDETHKSFVVLEFRSFTVGRVIVELLSSCSTRPAHIRLVEACNQC